MPEITHEGYQFIRDHIEATWTYMELRDENDQAITRIAITDPRLTWIHEPGAQVLILQALVKGADPDIPVPCTIKSSALFAQVVGGNTLSVDLLRGDNDVEVVAVVGASLDEVTVLHYIEAPRVVE